MTVGIWMCRLIDKSHWSTILLWAHSASQYAEPSGQHVHLSTQNSKMQT